MQIKKVGFYILLSLIIVIWLSPVIWMGLASFMPYQSIISYEFSWNSISIDNYKSLFQNAEFRTYLRNSMIITTAGTAIATLLGSFSALYSVRSKKFSKYFVYWIVSSRIIPPAAFLLPFYLMFQYLGMLNSITTLVLLGFALNYSLVFWLMRSVFSQIPREMEYSAIMDGASNLRAFFDTTIRYSTPGLLFVSIFAGIFIWNEYLLASVLTIDSSSQPLTVLLAQSLSMIKTDWGMLFAIGTIQIIPVLLLIMITFTLLRKKNLMYQK